MSRYPAVIDDPDDGVVITPIGAIFERRLSYEEWALVGRAVAWAVGDWLNKGERDYGEAYTQAVDLTGYTPEYLANLKYVAGRVDISRRREHLSLSHHQSVAKLAPDEQEEWLAHAEAEQMTRDELRRALAPPREPASEPEPEPESPQPDISAILNILRQLLKAHRSGDTVSERLAWRAVEALLGEEQV
jgi:hypothetical protein